MAKKTVLPNATVVRIAKESGIPRVAGFGAGEVVTKALRKKFEAIAKLLKKEKKKTLTKELLEAALA